MDFEEESDYRPSNREKARDATYGRFWCPVCDMDLMGELGKCSVCGAKGNPRKTRYHKKRSGFNP
jgi:hypothetical protein